MNLGTLFRLAALPTRSVPNVALSLAAAEGQGVTRIKRSTKCSLCVHIVVHVVADRPGQGQGLIAGLDPLPWLDWLVAGMSPAP